MNILEILRKELEGKKILLEKYHFQHPNEDRSRFPIAQNRYFLPGHRVLNNIKNDRNFKYLGTLEIPIVAVDGESDQHEGDSLYIRILDEGEEKELCITIFDELVII